MTCPIGCLDDECVPDSTAQGLRCLKCADGLVVDRITGLCGCPAGRFNPTGTLTCRDCPRGSWCAGGSITSGSTPAATACPAGMTTIGMRSTSTRSCVNLPGFLYVVDAQGLPGVFRCPINTYNPGMRRQRMCWPCPAGYTTNGLTGRTDVTACVVPPGSYMQFPTIVSLCFQGTWKSWVGADDFCNACPEGVTTAAAGATAASNCSVLLPGYYAAAMSSAEGVMLARRCPQKYFCPGGQPLAAFQPSNPGARNVLDTTLQPCPSGRWTQLPGATSAADCMTPPGHFTAGVTSKCAAGSFRAGWSSGSDAASCSSCGTGVAAVDDDSVDVYSTTWPYTSTGVAVTTLPSSCYIKSGQGLYYTAASNSFRARNCVSDNFGVNATTYGLTRAPCRACPLNMVTSTDAAAYPTSASHYLDNGDGRTAGFVSKWACVNRPGYGFTGRWSLPCPLGTFNAGDNWSDCTACGYGLTTAAQGAGLTFADCGIGAGFGFHSSSVTPCPVGYYNDRAINYTLTAPCLQCPTGRTTNTTGCDSTSDCDLCLPGFGQQDCATACGGVGASASYGQGLRALSTACVACPSTDLTVSLGGSNQTFVSPASAKLRASLPGDCLSLWSSCGHAWSLSEGPTASYTTATAASLSACLALCQAEPECQFASYLPATSQCRVRVRRASPFKGAPLIGFKALSAGNASRPSGAYIYYQDDNALAVGLQAAAPSAASFTSLQQCLDACDADSTCAGITMQMLVVVAERPTSCQLIRGLVDLSAVPLVHSFVRADATRLEVPVLQ